MVLRSESVIVISLVIVGLFEIVLQGAVLELDEPSLFTGFVNLPNILLYFS